MRPAIRPDTPRARWRRPAGFPRVFHDHFAHFQHVAARGQLQGGAGVLLHQQHGDAALVDGPHCFENGAYQQRSQPQRRLVQQKQARFGHQGPADGQHLLLAAGKRTRQLLLALQQAREKIKNPFQGAFAAGLVPDAECAQAQILQHAHGPEDPATLRGLGYAQAHHLMTGQAQQGLALKENLAFTGTHQTADGQ